MHKTEALAERARLQTLLDAYDAGRLTHQNQLEPGELTRVVPPDRAANVRARIARLDDVIAEIDDAERSQRRGSDAEV
jgi:hypothetical protein